LNREKRSDALSVCRSVLSKTMELVVDSATSCLSRLILCARRKPNVRHDRGLGAVQICWVGLSFSETRAPSCSTAPSSAPHVRGDSPLPDAELVAYRLGSDRPRAARSANQKTKNGGLCVAGSWRLAAMLRNPYPSNEREQRRENLAPRVIDRWGSTVRSPRKHLHCAHTPHRRSQHTGNMEESPHHGH